MINSVEEKVEFYDNLNVLTEGFFQYLHRERKEPDGATTLFKRFAEFYDADWIGLLDIDCSLGYWSAKCFYNRITDSSTETLIQSPERFDIAPSWVETLRKGEPVVVEDTEAIKEQYPSEYDMYKRLSVKSVIAVPYHNCNTGIMVVRNPKRFKDAYRALNVMAYIATTEISAKQHREHIKRMLDADGVTDLNTIKIKMLGDFRVEGMNTVLSRDDIKSELLRYVVAFMSVNSKNFVPATKLSEGYNNGDKETRWRGYVYNYRQLWRETADVCDEYQLIETCDAGYRINPKINLLTDIDAAAELEQTIDNTSVIDTKIQLLLDYYERFGGEFLPGDFTVDWVVQSRESYRQRYTNRVKELLKLLYDKVDYASIEKISQDMVNRYPESIDFRYWQILSQWDQRKADAVKFSMQSARNALDDYSWAMLLQLLIELPNMSPEAKLIFEKCQIEKIEE